MKGLELAEKFYNECGKPMLYEQFGDVLPYLAAGLIGSGSECLGYDDELSEDHDFEPGFIIFLPPENIVDRKTAFLLERAYAKLPKEFMGYRRSQLSPVGGNRHGVIRTEDFFRAHLGNPRGELSQSEFLTLPENYLLECTNGKIFTDNYGEVTKIRNNLSYFPEDVRLKKLAGYLLLAGQSGEYNFPRLIRRGDNAAAQLALFEFSKAAAHIFLLMNGKYAPYYKWIFRALRDLPGGADFAEKINFLISTPSDSPSKEAKQAVISDVLDMANCYIKPENKAASFEEAAYLINDKITGNELRNAHILSGV